MSHQDPFPLEHELSRLELPGLNAGLLNRLEACACGTWQELTAEEIQFEQQLRTLFKPTSIPEHFLSQLHSQLQSQPESSSMAFSNTPENLTHLTSSTANSRRHRPWWASAAAVALLGATAAWMLPNQQPRQQTTSIPAEIPATAPHSSRSFIPAGINRVISETRDEGVIWKPNQTPHRVLKVVYDELVTLKDENGKTYQVKQPRVEYFVVPTQPH